MKSFYIIGRLESNMHYDMVSMSKIPYRHDDYESASSEAKLLCKANSPAKFVVFKAVEVVEPPKQPECVVTPLV